MQLALPFSLLTLLTIVACATESSPPLSSSGNTGNPPAQSGAPGTGGKTSAGNGGAATGGASNTAGSPSGGTATGGQGNGGRSTAGAPSGGSSSQGGTGSTTPTSGGTGTAGASGGAASVSYALPPPSQCHNQDYIDYQEGCKEGDATSKCGGKCNTINACMESTATKPHADTTFICPRFMLFSDAMRQAAIDDGNAAFNYAVVGHDVDRGGIDGTDNSTCCQCYQLVYAYPSPANDRQAQLNPDNPSPPASAIEIPPPLIVQSFNTAATPHTFDVYMAAGGLGANNACAPDLQPKAASGQYLYSAYPDDGQPSQGGVKPASLFQECKTDRNWVTAASLAAPACQSRIEAACSEIKSDVPGLTEQAQRSCQQSNAASSFYHLNWSVYAMKVECPEHLTQVTGCKLAPQGLPAVDKQATTAEKAAANSAFWSHTSAGNQMYETTTMEDCCRPSCASTDWISAKGLKSDSQYNAFYSCDAKGAPITEKAAP